MSGALQGVALYLTLGLVCSSLGLTVYQWQLWALIALVWSVGEHNRQIGREETSTVMIIALKNMGVDVDRLLKVMTDEK